MPGRRLRHIRPAEAIALEQRGLALRLGERTGEAIAGIELRHPSTCRRAPAPYLLGWTGREAVDSLSEARRSGSPVFESPNPGSHGARAMPQRWVQIKGDPAIRALLFAQSRVPSLFDEAIDVVHGVVHALLTRKGVFHAKIHYSSSQLTCWFARDPFCYEKFVREEVISPGFLARYPDAGYEVREPIVDAGELGRILGEFKRLRLADENVYLRNAAINMINGMINLSFSCDGTHYIDHRTFLARQQEFESPPLAT